MAPRQGRPYSKSARERARADGFIVSATELAKRQRVAGLSSALNEELSKPEKSRLRVLQATASKTDLLLRCQWWVGKEVPPEAVGEPALFGSAFHEMIAHQLPRPMKKVGAKSFKETAAKWGVDQKKLQDRVTQAFPVLWKWLKSNEFALDFTRDLRVEVPMAYDLERGVGVEIPPHDENHHYQVTRWQHPGTVDLLSLISYNSGLALNQRVCLVLDHKTGYDIPSVAESGQLLSLALAARSLYQADRIIIGFFTAQADTLPEVLALELSEQALSKFEGQLQAAYNGYDSHFLHPDGWCGQCPGFAICPTQTTALDDLGRPRGTLTLEKAGAMHQKLQAYEKQFNRLADMLREEIRSLVEKSGPIPRPDGQFVGLVSRSYTNLSQASIKRALGEVKGGREIARLEKLGCIESGERLELRAIKD